MILFVDIEHESGYHAPHGESLLAGRARIAYRLQDLTGQVCLLQRYTDVTPELLGQFDISAMFLSGNSADPNTYDTAQKLAFLDVIASSEVPIFGFCGGHQWIAEALGVPVERIGPLPDGTEDPAPQYAPGWIKEVGYQRVEWLRSHPLTEGIDPDGRYRMAHTWEVSDPPAGFVTLAQTNVSPIQAMVHEARRIVGTQFHPEYWTKKDPAGEQLIYNFCRWAGVIPAS